MKETFTTKLMKRFYGITGPLDEYKRREIDRIGNVCFIYLSWVIIIGNLIAFLFAWRFPNIVAFAYPSVLMIAFFGTSIYSMTQIAAADLNQIDIQDLSDKEQKQLHHVGLKSGLYFGLSMLFGMPLLDYIMGGTPYFDTLFSISNLIGSLISAFLFGGTFHLVTKGRVMDKNDH